MNEGINCLGSDVGCASEPPRKTVREVLHARVNAVTQVREKYLHKLVSLPDEILDADFETIQSLIF